MDAMGPFVAESLKNGSVVQTGGLARSAAGFRIRMSGGRLTVTDGPFAESKEVIGGYALIAADTREAAVETTRAFMQLHLDHWPEWEGECEVREVVVPGAVSEATHRAIEAVWRIESARVIATLARVVGDVGLAEDLAQDALVAALEKWPAAGVPDRPGAWLMATAKRRALDHLRRYRMIERKHGELGAEIESRRDDPEAASDAALDDPVGDDLLALIFTTCHPSLSIEARVALTLRLLGGLTTAEIARAYLVPEPTVAQRIVRAKKTLTKERAGFEVAARRSARRTAAVGARGDLPDLQRGLQRDRGRRLDASGAVRGRAPARAHPRGTDAR